MNVWFFLLSLLEIVLTENDFLFENKFYRQLRGTTMGSNMAPSYANTFMAALKENSIYPSNFFQHVITWWHFIDDIFVIWTGSQGDLEDFFTFLNQIDVDIKLLLYDVKTTNTCQICLNKHY